MAQYRKIDVRIWNDEKFRNLSDDAQLAFIFVITHPSMTQLGAMRATISGLSAEKNWSLKRGVKAFKEVCANGLLEYSQKGLCIYAPNFLKYNAPQSANVVLSWRVQIDILPECDLKKRVIENTKAFLEGFGEGFRKAFREVCAQPSPNPEPEQELKQEEEKKKKTSSSQKKEDRIGTDGLTDKQRYEKWERENLEELTRKVASDNNG